jgi:hypothetical protein
MFPPGPKPFSAALLVGKQNKRGARVYTQLKLVALAAG